MFQIFFGDISLYNYLDSSGITVQDSLVPFINDITVQTKKQNGSTTEIILDLKMPGLLGCNMIFIPSYRGALFDHGIYNLRKDIGRTMIGYLYGGIKATLPNIGLSSANHKLFRLYLETYYPADTTADTTGFATLKNENTISVYTNLANDFLNFSGLKKNYNYSIEFTAIFGKIISKETLSLINTSFRKNIHQLSPGIYFIKISSEDGNKVFRFVKKQY